MKSQTKEAAVTYIASGGPVKQVQAQVVGEALARIKKKYGTLSPEYVVEEAKQRSSPLHRYFEWDTQKAARIYLLEQAARIIRCVEIVTVPAKTETVRAFVQTGERTGEYIERKEMLAQAKPRSFHVQHAIDELVSWIRRYSDFAELAREREAIQKLVNAREKDAAAE